MIIKYLYVIEYYETSFYVNIDICINAIIRTLFLGRTVVLTRQLPLRDSP